MKKHSFARLIWGVFLGCWPLLAGCTGTSVGNPPGATVQLGVVGSADETVEVTPQKNAAPLGGGAVLNQAWISLGRFELNSLDECGASGEPNVPEFFAVNLIDSEMYPSVPVWERGDSTLYCALNAEVAPLSQAVDGVPATLQQAAVYVEGARGDGVPFRISVPMDEPLRLEPLGKNEFELMDNLDALLIKFNLNAWLNPSELGQAEVGANGWVTADALQNPGLTANVRSRVGSSARLVRDRDKNGKLDVSDEEL